MNLYVERAVCPVCGRTQRITRAGRFFRHAASGGWGKPLDWTRYCLGGGHTADEIMVGVDPALVY